MSEISTAGLDLAKNVFQVHAVDASGEVVLRRQLRRGALEKFFAQLPPCTVGMEACGSAHHWARVIGGYGHQVRLMPPAYVKPYVKRNKNDGRDAEAICEAVSRPTMRFVAVKSMEQQAVMAVHTTRSLLVRQRTMIANSLRAALSELGIVAAQGIKGLQELIAKLQAPGEVPIDAGGSITMPLIGAVRARGLTPAGLASEISGKLRNGYIREPSVAVEIEAYRPFFILGEVAAPGQYPYVPNMSVESAVAIAGGFSPRARRDWVTLTHTDASGSVRAVVPLGTPISPGDIVLVGERWF